MTSSMFNLFSPSFWIQFFFWGGTVCLLVANATFILSKDRFLARICPDVPTSPEEGVGQHRHSYSSSNLKRAITWLNFVRPAAQHMSSPWPPFRNVRNSLGTKTVLCDLVTLIPLNIIFMVLWVVLG